MDPLHNRRYDVYQIYKLYTIHNTIHNTTILRALSIQIIYFKFQLDIFRYDDDIKKIILFVWTIFTVFRDFSSLMQNRKVDCKIVVHIVVELYYFDNTVI